jgi:hypothetical protein
VQTLLEDLELTADKDRIVAHAAERGSDPGLPGGQGAAGLPVATYRNLSEVRSSVNLHPDEMPG